MAKVAKPKKKDVSVRSRTARRAGSPTADLNVKAPVEETDYKPWLHNAQNAGIVKKKKAKQLTRQQRERHEKGLANGARNFDKHEKKVAVSKVRAKRVDDRRADWEELNAEITSTVPVETKKTVKANVVKDIEKALPMDGVDVAAPAPVALVEQTSVVIETPAEVGDVEVEVDEVT